MLFRLSVLSVSVIAVSCQLKVEVSSEDVIVPDTTLSPDPEPTSTEFESSKLDFLRRRRRKMMTSTVSPALKILPKEPRITMKPSTEIFKQEFEKKKARPTSSYFSDFKNKRRRFRPKLSKLKQFNLVEKNQDEILLKTNHSNKSYPTMKSFQMLEMPKSEILLNNKTSVLTQLQSPISDSFETTNMERNRVVLLHSNENEVGLISSETEVGPKYAHSTTTRTLSGSEDNFILKQVASLTESGLLNSSKESMTGNRKNDDVIEERKSEEESGAGQRKLNNIVEVTKDIADANNDTVYRFEYKILSDNSSNENNVDDMDNDSSPNLNTYSPVYNEDGLFHPENAPTYEQVLNFNSVKLNSLEILNDIDLIDSIGVSYSGEEIPKERDIHLPPPRPSHPPPKFFQQIDNFPVPVPQDYPINVAIDIKNEVPVNEEGGVANMKKELKTSEVNLDFELEPTSISESNTNFDGTILQRQEIPRTPKIEISPGNLGLEDSDGHVTQSKSVYTVTTPASYVFFEQTVAPAKDDSEKHKNKRVNNLSNKLETWKTKQRNKTLKPKHEFETLGGSNNEVERNSVSYSAENLVGPIPNLRIAEIASQDHYYPNQDSYFPSNSFNSGSRPSSYIPPIINPPPVTGINYSPPPSDSYSPPTFPQPQTPSILYQPGQFSPQTPVYHPPTSFNNIPTYQPFKPASVNYIPGDFVQSNIFFKPVKKRPPHKRHQKRYPNPYRPSQNSVSPGTKFHFVEEIYDSPLKTTVKRFPSESTSSLDVNRPGSGAEQGIVSLLKKEDLTVMAALLEETELDKSIDKQGQFTLFVPTDLAFNQFLQKLGGIKEGVNKLKQNPKELERIVKNHLVKGQVRSEDLADDLVGPSVALTKLRSNVYESEDRDWKDVKIITVNGALILKTDKQTANKQGLIHIVDRVLFPPTVGDVVETLQADPEQRFTTFIKALQATRLDKEITDYNTGPWTVFAPTNSAFMNLPMKELEELITNPKKLSKLVLNHLINRTVYSAGMRSHQRLTMANGNRVNLFARDDRLKIEGSSVINMDIPATNGVIQVVENIVEL